MRKERKDNFNRARDEFSFIETHYGMKCVYADNVVDAWQIRYESDSMYLNIGEMPPGFEFDMVFGRRGKDESPDGYPFTVADLLALKPCEEWNWTNETSTISAYAHILRKCGDAVLRADNETILSMKTRKEIEMNEWMKKEDSDRIRSKARDLWEAKEYPEYINALGELGKDLTALEKKRLIFARKKTRNQ